jgi:hypothetical protein
MTKKQFALIFVVWAILMSLLFCTPARAANIGLVMGGGITCEGSLKDLAATTIRLEQLKTLVNINQNPHAAVPLDAELTALMILREKIRMWREENCRDA